MTGLNKAEVRKEQIARSAERVFAEKGFHEATIADIARVAGVSEATIYEYFSNKEGLLFSIPLETTRRNYENASFHLKLIRGAANRLRAVIYLYLSFYQENPDYAAVVLLILNQNRKFRQTEAAQVISDGWREIIHYIKDGVASGEFRPDTNPLMVHAMIMGTIEHLAVSYTHLTLPTN